MEGALCVATLEEGAPSQPGGIEPAPRENKAATDVVAGGGGGHSGLDLPPVTFK